MKNILAIVPYRSIYPTINGGMHRCFHIICELAKHFNVTLIIFQDKESLLKAAEEYPSIKNIEIVSIPFHVAQKNLASRISDKMINAFIYRWYKRKLIGSADGSFLKYIPHLNRLLKKNFYDAILLENLATLNAVDTIRKKSPKSKIIYDAHNVDSNLARISVAKFGMKIGNLKKIQIAENDLHKNVDVVLACSEEDKKEFQKLNKEKLEIFVVPNGVELTNQYNEAVIAEKSERIIFCGSLWSHPNSEGLLWFYNNVWPIIKAAYPSLRLMVIGSGKPNVDLEKLRADPLVEFIGIVESVKPWYNKASVAIVPLLSGSGTRLKILEAMSFGIPVVSTSIGAEGIDYTNGKNIMIGDEPDLFSESIIKLLDNSTLRYTVQKNAQELIKSKYEWEGIGNRLADLLNHSL